MFRKKLSKGLLSVLMVVALTVSTAQLSSTDAATDSNKVGKVKIKSAKATKKAKIKVKWKKVKGASGYQLRVSKKKNGKSVVYKKTTKKTKLTTKKLKTGTYYIKVRAYKKKSGKKIYGDWSKAKKVKSTSTDTAEEETTADTGAEVKAQNRKITSR